MKEIKAWTDEQIAEYLMELWEERQRNTPKKIHIITWEGGIKLFHDMLRKEAEKFGIDENKN